MHSLLQCSLEYILNIESHQSTTHILCENVPNGSHRSYLTSKAIIKSISCKLSYWSSLEWNISRAPFFPLTINNLLGIQTTLNKCLSLDYNRVFLLHDVEFITMSLAIMSPFLCPLFLFYSYFLR